MTFTEYERAANCCFNSEITEGNFPGAESAVVSSDLEVVDLGPGVSVGRAIELIEERQLRPATVFEGFDYIAKNPDAQTQANIIVPQTVNIRGTEVVLFFGCDFEHGRHADLRIVDSWRSQVWDVEKAGMVGSSVPDTVCDKFLVAKK